MTEYYIVFLLTLLMQFYSVKSKTDYKWRLFFTFIPLFLFGALRVDINDYATYQAYYDGIHNSKNIFNVNERIEKGYAILNYIMPNFRSLLIFTSLLMCISYAVLFYKTVSPNYTWLAILLLFISGDKTIFFTLSAMRNGIVVSLLVLSFSLIKQRKIYPFIIVTFISYYIHASAIFFLPLAFLVASNERFKRRQIFYWSMITVIVLWISYTIVLNDISSFIDIYFDRYTEVVEFIDQSTVDNKRGLLAPLTSILLIISTFYYLSKIHKNTKENSLFKLTLLFLFSILLGSLNTRMSQYYAPFFIVATAFMYAKWNDVLLKNMYLIFVISFLGYGFFVVWMGSPYFAYNDYFTLVGKYFYNLI